MRTCIIVFMLLFVVSCKKGHNNDAAENSCDRIVGVFFYSPYVGPIFQSTATLTYDNAGHLVKVKGEGQNSSVYTYYNDSIVLTAKDIYGVDISNVYYLNSAHKVSHTKYANEDYQYNADGYMISYKQPYGNNGQITGYTPYYLSYVDGNLSEMSTPALNVTNRKINYQYYNEPNQNLMGYNIPTGLYDRNSFYLLRDKEAYFGKQSKNLFKSTILNDYDTSGNASYKYDSNGRITEMEGAYQFRYQCP